MESLSSHLSELQANYRKLFLEFAKTLQAEITKLKPKNLEGEIFDGYANDSVGKEWQTSVLKFIEEELTKIPKELNAVKLLSRDSKCVWCGVCCKFAVSEFSPVELNQKAKQGDNFATQFVKTFVPYENLDEVETVFPQYVEFLKNTDGGYYFYHCPKVTRDNKCPDYENRPQICRDFPDNPIAFLPLTCGFNDWKQKSENKMLELRAKSEILDFYKTKLLEIV